MRKKMSRREFLKRTSLTAAGLSAINPWSACRRSADPSGSTEVAASALEPPNILYIITDQQRFDAVRRVQDELADYEGKTKIRTPNLNRLSRRGAFFRHAYSQCPVCGPARGTLRTGCTIERTGVQTNLQGRQRQYRRMAQFQEKMERLESLDQVLVEDYGYRSEYYGKWHLSERFYYDRADTERVVVLNDYDYETGTYTFAGNERSSAKIRRYLSHFSNRGVISRAVGDQQQRDPSSGFAYTPIQLDVRYGAPTDTPITNYPRERQSQPNVKGRFGLSHDFTPMHFNGKLALDALDRLAQQDAPFLLTSSFQNPHSPMLASDRYLDHYWENRQRLFVSPSITDDMSNSAYGNRQFVSWGYNDPDKVKEWIACYYAMIEEIDTHVGSMLDKLDEHGITDNTLIVFTSDHGEMLGAHASREKNVFLEESVHIPLFLAFPGRIPADVVVDEPVSHLDLFATILDYVDASASDNSDGTSLRRFIEGISWNETHDERAIVAEWDFRDPDEQGVTLRRSLDSSHFMLLKRPYKLIVSKSASARRLDMMYNLDEDPYEVNNLIGRNGMTASDAVIGKAEHLKCLLVEWMERMDGGEAGYYSNPIYNSGEGEGDIVEVSKRRYWKRLDIWVGDTELDFGRPVWDGANYVRNEYLYIGRTTLGTLHVSSVSVQGPDSQSFRVDTANAEIEEGDHVQVKVTFANPFRPSAAGLDAHVRIVHQGGETIDVPIRATAKAP